MSSGYSGEVLLPTFWPAIISETMPGDLRNAKDHWEQHSTMVSILASGHSWPRFDAQWKKMSMLLRLINVAAQRKLDSVFKMLIEPI